MNESLLRLKRLHPTCAGSQLDRDCLDAPIRSICVSFGLELAETAAGRGAALLSTTAQELRRRRRSPNSTAGVGHGPATRRRPGRRSERLGLGQCAVPSGRHKRCQCREAISWSRTRRALPAGGLAGTSWPCWYDTAARRCDVPPVDNCVPARAALPALPGLAGTIPRQEVRRLAGRQLCAGAGGLAGTSWSGGYDTAAGGASSRRPATVCRRGRSCWHFLVGLVRYRGREVRRLAGRPLRAGAGGLAGISWAGWSGTAARRCVSRAVGHGPLHSVSAQAMGRARVGWSSCGRGGLAPQGGPGGN